jgi:hypothetical protein
VASLFFFTLRPFLLFFPPFPFVDETTCPEEPALYIHTFPFHNHTHRALDKVSRKEKERESFLSLSLFTLCHSLNDRALRRCQTTCQSQQYYWHQNPLHLGCHPPPLAIQTPHPLLLYHHHLTTLFPTSNHNPPHVAHPSQS